MAEEMVMVGCKAPNGLVLDLDFYVVAETDQRVRTIKGKLPPVTLKGWSVAFGMPDITTGGYALTSVPAAFWTEWYARNKDTSTLIADKIIIPPHKDTAGAARDHDTVLAMFPRRTESAMQGVKKLSAA